MSKPSITKRKYVILLMLIALLLAGWSAYWWMASRWLMAQVDEELGDWRTHGYGVEYSGKELAGWPYRFALTVEDLQITAPSGKDDWKLQQPILIVHAMAWDLSHLIVEAQGGTLLHLQTGRDLRLEHKMARASLILDHGDLSRFSSQLMEPVLYMGTGATADMADRVEVHVRPGEDDNQRKVYLRMDRLRGPVSPFSQAVDLRGELRVLGWNELINQRDLKAFRAAGGTVKFDDVTLLTDTAMAGVSGQLQIDENGFAKGELKTAFDKPGDMIKALDKNRIGEDGRDALRLLVLTVGNVEHISLGFRFKNGRIYTGPFKLMRTMPVIPPVNLPDNPSVNPSDNPGL